MLDPSLYPRSHRRSPYAGCATAASIRTRRSRRSSTLETARRRMIPELEGAEARSRTPRATRSRAPSAGAGHRAGAGSQPRARPADQAARRCSSIRSSTSAPGACCMLPNLPHASVPVGNERGRQRRSAPPRRAARVRLRRRSRTGISGRRSASSTSSAAPRSPARASRC